MPNRLLIFKFIAVITFISVSTFLVGVIGTAENTECISLTGLWCEPPSFYINLILGFAPIAVLLFFLTETRLKKKQCDDATNQSKK